jgi:multiple sugar transport system permease protein
MTVPRSAPALAGRVLTLVGAALVVLFTVLPMWMAVVMSLSPDPVADGTDFWPTRLTLDNYRILASPVFGFWPDLWHSVVLSTSVTVVSLVVAVPSAYALARLPVPGAARVLVGMLALAFFPGVVVLLPMSSAFSRLGWLDHLAGIGLAQLSYTVPLAVWFLTYAFRTVPDEVEDAAKVDGAGVVARVWRIILPMAGAGLAGTTALVFVASWNDFLFAGGLNRSDRSETLTVMLAQLPGIGFLGGQMAAAVLTCVPVALVLAVLLRWLSARRA